MAATSKSAEKSDEDGDGESEPELYTEEFQFRVMDDSNDEDFVGPEIDEEDNEDDFDISASLEDFHSELRGLHGFKKGRTRQARRGRVAAADREPSREVKRLLGEANQLYASWQLDESQKLLEEVIRIDNHVYAAWKTLGEIHRERGSLDKCAVAWIVAAHIKPKDAELWKICAKMSTETAKIEQAIFCYSKAISVDPHDIDSVYERAVLYRETQQYSKAIDAFTQLNAVLPNNAEIVRDLARLYVHANRVSEAIALYEDLLAYQQSDDTGEGTFQWNELNIIAELYAMQSRFIEAIRIIKSVGRWLNGRQEELFWDEYTRDDREWDADDSRSPKIDHYSRETNPEKYFLPIELRVKLGLYRLEVGNLSESLHHFNFLSAEPVTDFADLYIEVGDRLTLHQRYLEALHYYEALTEDENSRTAQLFMSMAACYKGVGEVEKAIYCYESVIANDETTIEARYNLAEIFEQLDRREEALDLVNQVLRLRSDANNNQGQLSTESDRVVASLIPNQRVTTPSSRRVVSRSEVARREEIREEQTRMQNRKLQLVKEGMENGVKEDVQSWMDTAAELVEDFSSLKIFRPAEKSAKFKGIFRASRRKKKDFEERIAGMASRLEESLALGNSQGDNTDEITEFRGLSFDTWFYIFMQYALLLALYEDVNDAYDVLQSAREANVFYQNRERYRVIQTLHLAEVLRWFMNTYQFKNDTFRLYSAALSSGDKAIEFFSNNANQKHILRSIKAIDSVVSNEKIAGMASITAQSDKNEDAVVPTKYNATLFMLYGEILNCCRSTVPALNYYLRAHAAAPNDPLICFSVGLTYLHRAMQRVTDNRHLQILQGAAFLFQYYKLRKLCGFAEAQESNYNMGRALQQIGLFFLSIRYYEKVVESFPSGITETSGHFDLKRHAAYNMVHIYMASGNPQKAKSITDQYLVL